MSALALFAGSALSAQPPAHGAIAGRVLNAATNEYVRNVEIRIDGTKLSATTEDGGFYLVENVPVGPRTVVALYPGAAPVSATLTVAAGATATRDFEIALTSARRSAEETVTLGAFVVEAEREGQSRMMAEQKQATNIKQVIAADSFGDMSEQNIGEFLKYIPGMTIDYVETDTRTASMGGMEPKYGYVTLDGNSPASGTARAFSGITRQFEFEAFSMNNLESVEVNKTLTADMPADAPAGTVNLRTRSALDLKRPRGGFSAGVLWNSIEHGLRGTPRPDEGFHAKTRPRFSFDYSSGPLLGGRLGVTVNGAFTNVFKEQYTSTLTYDYTSAQAIALGAPRITSLNFKDGPKLTEKSAGGVKVDYQASPRLRMTSAVSYAYFNDFWANRNVNFFTTAANLGAGSSLTRVVANNSNNANTRIDQTSGINGKLMDTINISYLAAYKSGPWTSDLSLMYSRVRETRGGLMYGVISSAPVRLSRIGFTAERTSVTSPSWHITQTAGPNWYEWNNWGQFDAQDMSADRQIGMAEQYTGKFDVKRVMSWSIPTSYKIGLHRNVSFRHRWIGESFVGRYIGTTGSALTARMPRSNADWLLDQGFGGGLAPIPQANREQLFALRREHPDYFSQSEANRAAELDDLRGSFQGNQEDINAAYVMQESKLGNWRFVAGLRGENTHTNTRAPREVPDSENPFSTRTTRVVNGRTVTTYTPANTRDYVGYRWSGGLVTSWGEYTDWMPSLAAKYSISKNLTFKAGYNQAIKRPDLNRVAGNWDVTIDDTTGDIYVTVPNPNLKPEHSRRYSAMLEYFFEPAGTFGVHTYQTELSNPIDNTPDDVTAEEAGFGDDPRYAGYFFRTFFNLNRTRRIRGIEFAYSQQLRFFQNKFLRAFSVFANYSQNSSSPRPRNGTQYFPRNASGGVTWSYGKYFFQVNGTWTDETFTGANNVPANSVVSPRAPEYFKPRTILFVNARYKLTRQLSLFVSGDRAYDSGKIWYYKSDGRYRQMERYGSQWSAGLKGDF